MTSVTLFKETDAPTRAQHYSSRTSTSQCSASRSKTSWPHSQSAWQLAHRHASGSWTFQSQRRALWQPSKQPSRTTSNHTGRKRTRGRSPELTTHGCGSRYAGPLNTGRYGGAHRVRDEDAGCLEAKSRKGEGSGRKGNAKGKKRGNMTDEEEEEVEYQNFRNDGCL